MSSCSTFWKKKKNSSLFIWGGEIHAVCYSLLLLLLLHTIKVPLISTYTNTRRRVHERVGSSRQELWSFWRLQPQ